MELRIRDLSKTYSNGVKSLQGVDLTIPTGMFGLLGPNGAGKSTLMRTIATLQDPDSGSITLGTLDVLRHKSELRRLLGYLPQEFGVYPGVSATDLLDHLAVLKGVRPRAQRREQVDALLERTGLFEHRKRAVATYSGGMRRRFGIAQALLGDPRLVIVDEPTAGLDPEERRRFHDLLAEIGEQVIVLLSTHIVADVEELCPRMAILSQGRVVLQGEPAPLIETLRGRVWRKTVARPELAAYRQSLRVLSTRLHAGRIELLVMADAAPDSGFVAAKPDLEDVYFSVLPERRAAA